MRVFGWRDDDIHVAPLSSIATRYRSKEGSMDNAARFEGRAELPKNGKGAVTVHDGKIRSR